MPSLAHPALAASGETEAENESWQTKRPRDRGEKPCREAERRGTDVKGGKGVAEAAREEAIKHCADQKLARPRGLRYIREMSKLFCINYLVKLEIEVVLCRVAERNE